MANTGKIMATSFIAGAAAALYASKHLSKNNNTPTARVNNAYETHTTTSTYNTTGNTPAQSTDSSWNTNGSNPQSTTDSLNSNNTNTQNTPNAWNNSGNTETTSSSWISGASTQTNAQKSNTFSKASPNGIDYNYDAGATSSTTHTPYNIYFQDETNSQPAGNASPFTNTTNVSTNSSTDYPDTATTIRIDTN